MWWMKWWLGPDMTQPVPMLMILMFFCKQIDSKKVLTIIQKMTENTEAWTYAKKAQKNRDGWMTYQTLFNHYLGPNNVNNMADTAEKKLTQSTCSGEKKKWNFEKYVSTQVQQH